MKFGSFIKTNDLVRCKYAKTVLITFVSIGWHINVCVPSEECNKQFNLKCLKNLFLDIYRMSQIFNINAGVYKTVLKDFI